MNTPYLIYEIDQRKKLNTPGDFENQTSTHIDATHAFSKNRPRKKVISIFNPGIQPSHMGWVTYSLPIVNLTQYRLILSEFWFPEQHSFYI